MQALLKQGFGMVDTYNSQSLTFLEDEDLIAATQQSDFGTDFLPFTLPPTQDFNNSQSQHDLSPSQVEFILRLINDALTTLFYEFFSISSSKENF